MLLRLIHLLILSSPVIAVTLWFSDNTGVVTLEWLGWRIETNVPVLLVALLLLFALLSGLEGLVGMAVGLPARLRASRRAKSHDQGMATLMASLKFAAAGNNGEARRLVDDAARLLATPELPERFAALLVPQGERPRPPPPASQSHSVVAAREERQPAPPASRWAWLRRPGRPAPSPRTVSRAVTATPAAAPPSPVVAEPAPASTPTVPFDADAFAEHLKRAEWDAALALATGEAVPAVKDARLRAVVLEAQALAVEADDAANAQALACAATKACPGFLPASLHAAKLLAATGQTAEAIEVIRAAWRAAPERPLLSRFLELQADAAPAARLEQVTALVHSNPDHVESHLAVGEWAAAAANWGLARRHLMAAIKARPDALACRLMAKVEERDTGDVAAVDMWRRKADAAGPPPSWRCGGCSAEVGGEVWQPACPSCGAIATIEWSAPAVSPSGG